MPIGARWDRDRLFTSSTIDPDQRSRYSVSKGRHVDQRAIPGHIEVRMSRGEALDLSQDGNRRPSDLAPLQIERDGPESISHAVDEVPARHIVGVAAVLYNDFLLAGAQVENRQAVRASHRRPDREEHGATAG